MDLKLELVAVPVSDVDRAKAFYTDQVGFAADVDARASDDVRFVQLTPPGSACSIAIGNGITSATPGSVEGLQMVVTDVAEARRALAARASRSATSRNSRGVRSCTSAIRTATAGRCSSFRRVRDDFGRRGPSTHADPETEHSHVFDNP